MSRTKSPSMLVYPINYCWWFFFVACLLIFFGTMSPWGLAAVLGVARKNGCHMLSYCSECGFQDPPMISKLAVEESSKELEPFWWCHDVDQSWSIYCFSLLWGWFQNHSVWCVLSKLCSFLLQGGAPVSEVGFGSWTIFYGYLWVLALFRTMFTWILPSGKLN